MLHSQHEKTLLEGNCLFNICTVALLGIYFKFVALRSSATYFWCGATDILGPEKPLEREDFWQLLQGADTAEEPLDSQFLLLPETFKFCEGSSVLLASDVKVRKVASSEVAARICLATTECSFTSFTTDTIAKWAPTYERNPFQQERMTWICSGSGWMESISKKNWATAVRASEIEAAMPNYVVSLNTRAGLCTKHELVNQAVTNTAPGPIADTCDSESRCSYVIANFVSSDDTIGGRRIVTTYYCSGSVRNERSSPGWIVARKKTSTRLLASLNGKSIERVTVEPSLSVLAGDIAGEPARESLRGSVTQDSFYMGHPTGVLIAAKRIT